jgi:hypothetical protein
MSQHAPAWRRPTLAVSTALLLTACTPAGSPSITVSDARVPEPAGPNGAAYMTLANDGEGDGRLVAVETDVADVAEIHETTMNDGSMSMQQVDGIDVPAGGSTALEPGGLHVMLLNVDQDLAVGDTVALVLTFDGGDEQTVDAEVVPLSPDAG